jgi:hypothetical protein
VSTVNGHSPSLQLDREIVLECGLSLVEGGLPLVEGWFPPAVLPQPTSSERAIAAAAEVVAKNLMRNIMPGLAVDMPQLLQKGIAKCDRGIRGRALHVPSKSGAGTASVIWSTVK